MGGNLACVSPVKAREIKEIAESQVEPNVVIDFNLEHHDEGIDKFNLSVDGDDINSFSLNLEPNQNWPGTHDQDIIRDMLMMSVIDIGFKGWFTN